MPELQDLDTRLRTFAGRDVGHATWGAKLSRHCFWRIGGSADLMVEPGNVDQVRTALSALHELDLPYVVIGEGSNLLFDDAGVRGVVLKIGYRLSRVSIQGGEIDAEAGVYVPTLARKTARAGLTGLEHIVGIPGTLGGLLVMNGGSQRNAIGANVVRVWVVGSDGTLEEIDREECHFSYRNSSLQEGGKVIVRAQLSCQEKDPKLVRHEMLQIMRSRRGKFPLNLPNCGSVFLSNDDLHAKWGPPGKLIEDSGLRGYRIGNAQVSTRHCNFIVNLGNASSAEVMELARLVAQKVYERTGARLQCEVKYVKPDCRVASIEL